MVKHLNDIDLVENALDNASQVDLKNDLSSPPTKVEGRVYYDPTDHALSYYNDASDVTINVGQEEVTRVYNNTGGALTDGQAVYITGVDLTENIPTVALARADQESTSKVLGVVTGTIADATYGYVTSHGFVKDIDTSAFTAGDKLWLSPTVAGGFVNTQPVAPNQNVEIGFVLKADTAVNNGRIIVQMENFGGITADLAIGTSWNSGLAVTPTPATPSVSDVDIASGTYYVDGVLYELTAGAAPFTITMTAAPDIDTGTTNYEAGMNNGDRRCVAVYATNGATAPTPTFKTKLGPIVSGNEKCQAPSQPNDTVCLAIVELEKTGGSLNDITTNEIDDCRTGAPDRDETVKVSANDQTIGFLNGKLVAGTGVTLTENNDGASETLTVAQTANSVVQQIEVDKNSSGTPIGTRKRINFIEGTNVTLTVADDAGNDEVDVTINSTAAGGSLTQDSAVVTQFGDETRTAAAGWRSFNTPITVTTSGTGGTKKTRVEFECTAERNGGSTLSLTLRIRNTTDGTTLGTFGPISPGNSPRRLKVVGFGDVGLSKTIEAQFTATGASVMFSGQRILDYQGLE